MVSIKSIAPVPSSMGAHHQSVYRSDRKCHNIIPLVTLSFNESTPDFIVVPPITIVVLRRHAAHRMLCSLEANWRNWTEPRHSGVAHDVYLGVPLDVPNGGWQCEYKDINDHDVVMSEIPWLCAVVDESTLPYAWLILNPTWNPFSSQKHTPQTPPNSHLWHRRWSKTRHNTLGRKQIDPLNFGPLGDPLILDN